MRMPIAIENATVVTSDAARTVHHDASIVVDADRIVAIGPTGALGGRYPGAERVDGRGKAVFPGLVNCHTHLWFTVARGIQEDFGFPSTLRFPTTAQAMLSAEETAVFAMLGALECLRGGNTTLLEIGTRVPDYARPVAATGLRVVFGQTSSDLEPAGIAEGRFDYSPALADRTLRGVDDVISAWHGAEKGRITCVVAAHAAEACSPELLRAARELAERRDVRTTIHLDQSHWEVESVMRVRGVRPAEYLFQHGFLSPRLVAAHCRFMTPGEISHLGRSRVSVSHNAAMAARRAAAPPIQALAAAGCNIAMGTDNMAHDMLEAMRTGLFVERISRQDGERPWPEDVLEWGTTNGAAALGLGAATGSLEVGKKADLVVVDARRPHLVPALRIVSAWIHNGQAGDVESVMVDGRWLMRDRRVLTIDEGDVVARAEEIARRVWRQLVDRYPDVPFPIRLPPPVSGPAGAGT
jgi:cytosine/adenosine deaminase-related metal-dependent hydrolase